LCYAEPTDSKTKHKMDQKQDIADRLKTANNILVTVSNNPSVDQLASCIGLTLVLNKMGKHATAVFSGTVPSTIEFLQPEKTLEKNTDSLRDFIIALDKAKADKLRYKVEDKIVKIFITPYKTSLSEKDLEFSQGDFNVDVVIALGVHNQADLDQAITAHGRILHDAAVVTVNTQPGGELGSINWVDPKASSLSELVVQVVGLLDKQLMDGQIATALLTGIVAETDRFSNEKTSPATMSMSAELMSAGANQQLVVAKLKVPEPPPPAPAPLAAEPEKPKEDASSAPQPIKMKNEGPAKEEPKTEDGTLEISHLDSDKPLLEGSEPASGEEQKPEEQVMPQIKIDDQGSLHNLAYEEIDNPAPPAAAPGAAKPAGPASTDPNGHLQTQHMVLQPPSLGGQLTANTMPEDAQPVSDPLSLPPPGESAADGPLLQRSPFSPPASASTANAAIPFAPPGAPPLPPPAPPAGNGLPPVSPPSPPTSPPASAPAPPAPPLDDHVDSARDAVSQAINAHPAQPGPIQALNAQPLGEPLRDQPPGSVVPPATPVPGSDVPPAIPPQHPSAGPPPPPVPPPMTPLL
jgi:hypothetical protein